MKKLKELSLQSEFFRNVLTLMPGTLLSQAIPIIFSIILARIYAPELFGIYFVFTAILSLGIIFATGKFEMAILLPESDQEASGIIGIALTTCIVFSLSLLVLFVVFNQLITRLLQTPNFEIWLIFVPLSLFFSAANEVFYYWHNRMKRYSVLSYSKIIQSLSSSLLQLILGFLILGETGLIAGLILGQAISFFFLYYHYRIKDKARLGFRIWIGYKVLAKKYIRFPKDIATASFINEMANQIPNLFMTRYLGQTVVGHYGYAQRTLRTPLGVISNAFSDVFKSRAATAFNETGSIRSIFFKTLKSLTLLSFVPFLILFFIAPDVFSLVFGKAYAVSGIYARIFCIPLFLSFVVSPLSSSFYIVNRTSSFLILQIIGLALVVLSISLAWIFSGEAVYIMMALAAALSINSLLVLGTLIFIPSIRQKTDPAV